MKFARGDRVRIVKIIITHEDQRSGATEAIKNLGKTGVITYVGHLYLKETEFPFYVTMDDPDLDYHCYWREEELEHV